MGSLGSFSVAIANTIQRSRKVELATCFDVAPKRRKATRERYGCEGESSFEDMVKRNDLDGVLLPDQSTRLEFIEKGRTEAKPIPLLVGDPMLEEIDEFADCVLTGRKPETDGRSALKALALIRAAIESARGGRPAEVERSAETG